MGAAKVTGQLYTDPVVHARWLARVEREMREHAAKVFEVPPPRWTHPQVARLREDFGDLKFYRTDSGFGAW